MDKDLNFGFDDFENDIVDGIVDNEPEIVDDVSADEDAFNAPVQRKQANVPSNDLSFDFSSLGLKGVIVGDIGLEVSRFVVDKLKFNTNQKTLISIVSPQVVAIKTHYIPGVGSILCHAGACCEVDNPRIRYVFPVVVYDTDRKGKPVSKKLQFKALCVGKEAYESIMTKHDLCGDITSVDLLVTCTDEAYQRIQLDTAGDCRWQKNQGMVKQVQEFWSKNMKHLLDAIAKPSNDRAIREAIGDDNGPNDADVNFDDIFE